MRRLLLVLLLLAASGCGSPFFHPWKEPIDPALPPGVAKEDVFFPSRDGVRLHGWILSPAGGGPARGTLLFLHGNAGNVGMHAGSVAWVVEAGYRVFLPDYRGYGRSEGTPTVEGVHEDALAALALLPTLPGVDRGRIAVLGQSLGGSVAVYAAANAPERGLVKGVAIEGAFAGWRRIVKDTILSYPLGWVTAGLSSRLFEDRYSAERWIGTLPPVPVVVIHGTADPVVPFAHGEILYGLARDPKAFWIVEGGGHITAFRAEAMRRRFLAFLEGAFGDAPGRQIDNARSTR